MLAVNVRGTFECSKAVVPGMRSRGYGKIINIASGTVFKGSPLMAHYVTSKGAVIALTRSLARELGPTRHPRQLHRARPDPERRRDLE